VTSAAGSRSGITLDSGTMVMARCVVFCVTKKVILSTKRVLVIVYIRTHARSGASISYVFIHATVAHGGLHMSMSLCFVNILYLQYSIMAPSCSLSNGTARDAEVIDLLSSDDENQAPSYANVVAGKRSRDASATISNDRVAKKGGHISSPQTKYKQESEKQGSARHSTCMPFINADVPDNAIVTDTIMPLLHRLNIPGVLTCSGRKRSSPTTSSLLHIQQTDKWSCGFRNLQMLLSALLPQVVREHKFYQSVPASLGPYPNQDNRPIPIPSLHQLQTFLEDLWKCGFDERGAQHYRHRIVGKSSQIGAIEVSTILSYLYLDSAVVQFIKCKESKALLGPFVWQYFVNGPCFAFNDASSISCSTWAERLLDAASRTGNDEPSSDACKCPILPLYLQWEGHSATIVGVERTKTGDFFFLMFDPLKTGTALKQSLQSTQKNVLSALRLSAKSFLNKDCQVVMSSARELQERERAATKGVKSNIVTAAEEAVARFCQR